MDQSILDELVELAIKLIKWWVSLRLADIVIRAIFFGQFMKMLTPWYLPLLFLAEMLFIAVPAWLAAEERSTARDHYQLFISCFFIVLGGMGYRFDPTTFAYRHWARTYYTPARDGNSDFPGLHLLLHHRCSRGRSSGCRFCRRR